MEENYCRLLVPIAVGYSLDIDEYENLLCSRVIKQ